MAALLLGTILRFSGIESRSLWGDEIMSLALATGHTWVPSRDEMEKILSADYYRGALRLAPTYFSQRVADVLRLDSQPPFYYFLLNVWLHLFGTSATALRSLSASASIASILVLYALGRRLASPEVAVYSALIFATAPFQLAFAQYARPYALLGLLALLSTLVAVRLSQGEDRGRWLLAYGLVGIVGLYTHYLFLWNVLFHWVLVGWGRYSDRRFLLRWGFTQVCIGVAFLPWMPIFLAQIRWHREWAALNWFYWHTGTLAWADVSVYLGRDLVLLLTVGGVQGLCPSSATGGACRLAAISTGLFSLVPVLVLGFCAWRGLRRLRLRFWRQRGVLDVWSACLLWGLCIFGPPLIIDRLVDSHSIKIHRYFISASGPLYLAVATTFASVVHRRRRLCLYLGFLLFLLAGSGMYLLGFSRTLINEQGAREVARYLDHSLADHDLVLLLNPGPNPLDFAYYLRSNPDIARLNLPERWLSSPDIPIQLHSLTGGRRYVWYLDEHGGPETKAKDETLSWLRARYQETEVRAFQNLDLFRFSSPR